MKLSPEVFTILVGALLSLASDLLPKFKDWFGALPAYKKRWATIVMNLLVAVVLVLLSCFEATSAFIGKYIIVICSEAGIVEVVEVFIFMIVGSQATFLIAPVNGKGKPKS